MITWWPLWLLWSGMRKRDKKIIWYTTAAVLLVYKVLSQALDWPLDSLSNFQSEFTQIPDRISQLQKILDNRFSIDDRIGKIRIRAFSEKQFLPISSKTCWRHHFKYVLTLTLKNQILVKNLRIITQLWTLSEGHLLRLYCTSVYFDKQQS